MASRLKRTVIWVLIVLVAAVVLGGIILALNLGKVVKTAINEVGPKVVKVPLKVDDVSVSVLGGSFVMKGFAMGNPPGFKSPNSVTIDRLQVDAKIKSLEAKIDLLVKLIQSQKTPDERK